MKYTLINPSDPYTLEADDLSVAALVCCLLGDGKYALADAEGKTIVPTFIFSDPDDWFRQEFGTTVGETMHTADPRALVACFESVTLQRAEPSSLNNIGERATMYATLIRGSLGTQNDTPESII